MLEATIGSMLHLRARPAATLWEIEPLLGGADLAASPSTGQRRDEGAWQADSAQPLKLAPMGREACPTCYRCEYGEHHHPPAG